MMWKIINFLNENEIEFECVTFGDAYRYGVEVDGLEVFFHKDFPESLALFDAFRAFMRSQADAVIMVEDGGYYYCCHVMSAEDRDRLISAKEAAAAETAAFFRSIGR